MTPIVRKLANEQGVDLATVTGTGVGGRIRKQDVHLGRRRRPRLRPPQPRPARAPLETSPLRGTTVPMSRLRKVVAERAVVSMQSTAQLTTVVEVDVTQRRATAATRSRATSSTKTGNKLSFLPFFALAAAEALRAYPIINSTVDGDSIVYPPTENIEHRGRHRARPAHAGASATPATSTSPQIAAQIADLADAHPQQQAEARRAVGRHVHADEHRIARRAVRHAGRVPPAVGDPRHRHRREAPGRGQADGEDAIAIRSMVYLALSYDHRIIDGADAARFLTAVKERLEDGDFEAELGI